MSVWVYACIGNKSTVLENAMCLLNTYCLFGRSDANDGIEEWWASGWFDGPLQPVFS